MGICRVSVASVLHKLCYIDLNRAECIIAFDGICPCKITVLEKLNKVGGGEEKKLYASK